jgi:hypothetical protein
MSEQTMKALGLANHVRRTRALYKKAVRLGDLDVAELLTDIPAECRTMTLDELLRSQNQWGRLRTDRFCHHLHLWPYRPLGKLTAYQRRRIIEAL